MRGRWVCLAIVVFALSGSLPADAYVARGRPWPGGVIRYYNAASDQAWAVKRAADAWNASGARLRFVATSAAQADVRIEHFPGVACTINAEATVGYTAQRAHLDLQPRRRRAVLQPVRGGALARPRVRPRPRARARDPRLLPDEPEGHAPGAGSLPKGEGLAVALQAAHP